MRPIFRIGVLFLVLGIASGLIFKFYSRSGSEAGSGSSLDAGALVSRPAPDLPSAAGSPGAVGSSGDSVTAGDPPTGASTNGASLSQSEQRKLAIISEILSSKNDNDPRYDTELRDFSPEAKRAMVRRYADTRPEKRNERGTYVFVIGREIKDAADVAFLKSVLNEKPCLSLENCDRAPESGSGEEEHLGAINETTANYPQLVAIRALKHRMDEMIEAGQESAPLFSVLLQTIRESKSSSNPRVVEEATRILKEMKRD